MKEIEEPTMHVRRRLVKSPSCSSMRVGGDLTFSGRSGAKQQLQGRAIKLIYVLSDVHNVFLRLGVNRKLVNGQLNLSIQ